MLTRSGPAVALVLTGIACGPGDRLSPEVPTSLAATTPATASGSPVVSPSAIATSAFIGRFETHGRGRDVLEMRPDGAFVSDWITDTTYGRGQVIGEFRVENDWLYLITSDGMDRGRLQDRYALVGIDGDDYLVGERSLDNLCNHLNEGWAESPGPRNTLRRTRGFPATPPGPPKLPESHHSKLLQAPISTTLTAVSKSANTSKPSRVEFHCDRGADQGLWVGMKVFVEAPLCGPFFMGGRLTAVACDRSEGFLFWPSVGEPQPEPGWKIATRKPVLAR